MSLVKIVSTSWMSSFPVTSGENKSILVGSLEEFCEGVMDSCLRTSKTEIGNWIKSSGFFTDFPVEHLGVNKDLDRFARILRAYNHEFDKFIEENQSLYLWYNPNQ